jgi:hypothetical protein
MVSGMIDDPKAVAFTNAIFESLALNVALIGLDADHERIATLVVPADFVLAIWSDASLPNGVDVLCVKGHEFMDEQSKEFLPCVAIPCADESAARRLQARYGD